MTAQRVRPLLLPASLAATLFLAWSPPAAATIDSVTGGCRPSSSGPVFLNAGTTTELTVKGTGVDFVQRVEDTNVGGVRVRIGERKGGLGTFVKLDVTVDGDIRHGDQGRVRLAYPIGEDSFPVKLVGRVTVTSIAVEGESPVGGVYRLEPNRDYVLAVRGTNLSILDPDLSRNGAIRLTVLSRSDGEARVKVRSSGAAIAAAPAVLLRSPDAPCTAPAVRAGALGVELAFSPPPGPSRTPAGAPPPAPPPVTPSRTPTRVPPAAGGPTVTPTRTAVPARAAFPDLLPTFQGAPFRHLGTGVRREVNGQTFCNAIFAQAVQNTLADITPPVPRWGVTNTGAADVTATFAIRLAAGGQVVNQTVTGLRVGETKLFDVPRPATQTNVTRIGNVPDAATRQRYGESSGGRCVQSDPQRNPSFEWQDPTFTVTVDTGTAVDEGPTGGESNNSRPF